jgi:pilus assembly protein Flp/PilA
LVTIRDDISAIVLRRTVQREGMQMLVALSHFKCDEAGATAIEYGLIAGGIALAIVSAIGDLFGAVSGTFRFVSANMP